MRYSQKDVEQLFRNVGKPFPGTGAVKEYAQKSSNKHRNVICEADNMRFPSKKHRQHYFLLRAMQSAGEIRFFLREVPFDLIGHYENGKIVRHFVDFQLVLPDWTVRWQEVKGRDLPGGKVKNQPPDLTAGEFNRSE